MSSEEEEVVDTPKHLIPPSKKDANTKGRGVVYISRIPGYMNSDYLRKLLTKRFEICRIYLQAEHENITRQRKKSGGNRKVRYIEGWIEFELKKDAKMAAMALNNSLIGGKKRHNQFRDDTWNLKYLKGFKWYHLTEKLAYD